MRRSGGLRERRLLVDAERIVQSRRDAVLDDRPPDRAQVVAHAAVERRLMCLHFFADAARDGILVALAARIVVEQGAEPGRRRELGLKHATAPLDQGAHPVYTARLTPRVVWAHVDLGHMSSSRRRDSRMMSRNTAKTADSASGPGFASTTSRSTARSRAGARSGNPAARFDRAILRASRARRFSRRTSTRSR